MPKKRRSRRIDSIVRGLLAYEPQAVYLFGSWARDENDELSDVDLVIIKRTCLPFFDRLMEASKHLPADAGGIDLLVYTPEEFHTMLREGNAFAEMIAEESILIYGHKQEN